MSAALYTFEDVWAMYAASQGRTASEQLRHDLSIPVGQYPMKGYVNYVREHNPFNRRADGTLIHPLIP